MGSRLEKQTSKDLVSDTQEGDRGMGSSVLAPEDIALGSRATAKATLIELVK